MGYFKKAVSNLLAVVGFFLVAKFFGSVIYDLTYDLLVSLSLMPHIFYTAVEASNSWRTITHDLWTGISEEAAFRYFLFDVILRKILVFPKWHALIMASVFFGLAHFNNLQEGDIVYMVVPQVVMAAFVGVLFGYAYLRKGLWLPILVHALYNNSVDWSNQAQSLCITAGGFLTLSIVIHFIVCKIRDNRRKCLRRT